MYRYLIPLLVLGVLLTAGCLGLHTKGDPLDKFHGKDRQMMEAAKRIEKMINNYHVETAEWPENLAATATCMTPGETWPDDPYNGKPITDTGSPDFVKGESEGMVYYQKISRNDMVVSYMLHVYGQKGKLYIIGNSAFGAKE